MTDYPAVPWRRRMRARDAAEPHRAATPLELFYDLCFVVAVAAVSHELHHAETEGHLAFGLLGYLPVFFTIWWAWMNFTWFASAYDPDDTPYRLCVLVQILGVLILSAGVAPAFAHGDFRAVFAGYVMRIGLETQRLRAARADPSGRRTMRRYVAGESTALLGWAVVVFTLTGAALTAGFVAMAVVELLVPV
ncbi:hypothetical protein GCM10023223_33060 [Stackebrandtia albiflava]